MAELSKIHKIYKSSYDYFIKYSFIKAKYISLVLTEHNNEDTHHYYVYKNTFTPIQCIVNCYYK